MPQPAFERSLGRIEPCIGRLLRHAFNYFLNDLLSLAIRRTGLARGVVDELPIDVINEIFAARWERAITFAVVRIERGHTC